MLHACTCSSVVLTTRMKCTLAERRLDRSLTKKHATALCHRIFKLWPRLCTKRRSSVYTTSYTRKKIKHVLLDWVFKRIEKKTHCLDRSTCVAPNTIHAAAIKMCVSALEFEPRPALLITGTFASRLPTNNRTTIVFRQFSSAWGNVPRHLVLLKQQEWVS